MEVGMGPWLDVLNAYETTIPYICDRIWQKPAWTHTVSMFTFHHQSITVHSSLVCFPHGLSVEHTGTL